MKERKTICIPLLGKGATNHLHKQILVDEFSAKGINVLFLVRQDYISLLNQLSGCSYVEYSIPLPSGRFGRWIDACRHFRRIYHPSDPWVQIYNQTRIAKIQSPYGKAWAWMIIQLARSQQLMRFIIWVEGFLHRLFDKCDDLDRLTIDGLLIMSSGVFANLYDIRFTWWAYRNKIPIIHIVGNYDNLSSNGFRGFPIRRLLVWGDRMLEDAQQRHCLSASNIRRIGALRYNMLPPRKNLSRDGFLREIGFDPTAKTIVFGGSSYEYHYFEILPVFEELKQRYSGKLQLIIRVYPNKRLLDSPFITVLMAHASQTSDIWISVGDPNYKRRQKDTDVIEIDEKELWQLLNAADVVVNLFSTLALEACLFDKPVIHMWYFLSQPRALQQPIYYPTNLSLHNIRAVESGAVTVARNREELIQQILHALDNPQELREARRRYWEYECGNIDGCGVSRLVSNCDEMMAPQPCDGK